MCEDTDEHDYENDEYMRRIDALEAGECPSCGADIGVWIDLGDTECPECGATI